MAPAGGAAPAAAAAGGGGGGAAPAAAAAEEPEEEGDDVCPSPTLRVPPLPYSSCHATYGWFACSGLASSEDHSTLRVPPLPYSSCHATSAGLHARDSLLQKITLSFFWILHAHSWITACILVSNAKTERNPFNHTTFPPHMSYVPKWSMVGIRCQESIYLVRCLLVHIFVGFCRTWVSPSSIKRTRSCAERKKLGALAMFKCGQMLSRARCNASHKIKYKMGQIQTGTRLHMYRGRRGSFQVSLL